MGIFRKPRHPEKGQAFCFSHRTMGLHLQLLGTEGQPLTDCTEVLLEPGVFKCGLQNALGREQASAEPKLWAPEDRSYSGTLTPRRRDQKGQNTHTLNHCSIPFIYLRVCF